MLERKRSWTREQLEKATLTSTSVRQTLKKLGLVEAGGNYDQIKKYLRFYKINTEHFRGMAWNKGLRGFGKPLLSLEEIMTEKSTYQSYKLKKRLFECKIKTPQCEFCKWAQMSEDGRIPLELDHINGDRHDNRLKNLRILCPNCHSLQPTHRGKNMRKKG